MCCMCAALPCAPGVVDNPGESSKTEPLSSLLHQIIFHQWWFVYVEASTIACDKQLLPCRCTMRSHCSFASVVVLRHMHAKIE